jgi:hypothetical protein
MHTHSSKPRAAEASPVASHLQPPAQKLPMGEAAQPQAHDFSAIDLFAHDPGSRSLPSLIQRQQLVAPSNHRVQPGPAPLAPSTPAPQPNVIQRQEDALETSASLTEQFRQEKLLGRFKPWRHNKPNADLQNVFVFLDSYHAYLQGDPTIASNSNLVDAQVNDFQTRLELLNDAANRYVQKHQGGKKTPVIEQLAAIAQTQINTLTKISDNPTLHFGKEWRQALTQVVKADLPNSTELEQQVGTAPEAETLEPNQASRFYSTTKDLESDYDEERVGDNTKRFENKSRLRNQDYVESKYFSRPGQDAYVRRLKPEELATYELTSKKLSSLSPEEQEKYRGKTAKEDTPNHTPIFFWNKQPHMTKPFSTETMKQASLSGQAGRAIFVMTQDGKIYAADQTAEEEEAEANYAPLSALMQRPNLKFHHSSFLRGQPIAAAGELIFKDGLLCGVTNSSGHYKPGVEHMVQVLQEFQQRGVDLSDVQVTIRKQDSTEAILLAEDLLAGNIPPDIKSSENDPSNQETASESVSQSDSSAVVSPPDEKPKFRMVNKPQEMFDAMKKVHEHLLDTQDPALEEVNAIITALKPGYMNLTYYSQQDADSFATTIAKFLNRSKDEVYSALFQQQT